MIGAIEAPPIVVADAAAIFGGRPGTDFAARIDDAAVGALLDDRNVTDTYIRKLVVVALKRAALQASAS